MNLVKNFLILFLLLGLISCGGNDDAPIQNTRSVDDVRSDFSNLKLQPGNNDISMESIEAGVFWNFRIIVPSGASETNKRPLILSLHGAASNILPNAHLSTSCLVEAGFADLNAFIISPNSDGHLWFEPENQIQVSALIDLAKSYLFVDENKVVVTGYSDGGTGSWFFAEYYSELFSAAIPMASSYNPEKSNGVVPKINTPLYVIHGEKDDLFPVSQTQSWVNQSISAGSSIEFVIAAGLVHNRPCDYVSYLQDAASWLQTDVWN